VVGEAGAGLLARPRPTDAEIAAEALRRQEEARRIEALRPPLSAELAQRELQRRGRTVYSASVVGGPKDRWVVSGLGTEVTEAQLIAEAKRVMERERR